MSDYSALLTRLHVRSDPDSHEAAQAIERLEALVGGICAYPMCDCKGPGCQVLDAAVPEVCARSDLIEAERELAEVRAEIERKDEILQDAGEMINLLGAKLNMPVEGSDPKSDRDSMGCVELLSRIRKALAAPAQEPCPECGTTNDMHAVWCKPLPKPHYYRPDYMAMGDCKVCGHVKESPLHIGKEPAPTSEAGPAPEPTWWFDVLYRAEQHAWLSGWWMRQRKAAQQREVSDADT